MRDKVNVIDDKHDTKHLVTRKEFSNCYGRRDECICTHRRIMGRHLSVINESDVPVNATRTCFPGHNLRT
jgi:transcription antitermination factor NusA-like protein